MKFLLFAEVVIAAITSFERKCVQIEDRSKTWTTNRKKPHRRYL